MTVHIESKVCSALSEGQAGETLNATQSCLNSVLMQGGDTVVCKGGKRSGR